MDKKFTICREWKIALGATWIVGLLAHAYRFFNFLPNWDSMHNFQGTGGTVTSGRWFLEVVSRISSPYDMPWINGAVSLLYLSIISILITEMYELKSNIAIGLTAAILVSYPTICSNFAYMFTADGYMAAFLLAVIGIWITKKYKWGFLAGMLFICLSMGTYQAYLSVALMLVILLVLKDLLVSEKLFMKVFSDNWIYGVTVVGGAVLNSIATKVINKIFSVTLDSYQGINNVGLLEKEDYLIGLKRAQASMKYFLGFTGLANNELYSYISVTIVMLIFCISVWLVFEKKMYKKPLELICIMLCFVAMPIACFIILFVSTQVSYHTLMVMSVCMVYLLLVILIECGKSKVFLWKWVKRVSAFILGLFVYYNVLHANYAYFQMNLSYEKSYALSSDVLERVEWLQEADKEYPIAIMGYYEAATEEIKNLYPEIAGASDTTFLNAQAHYIKMWQYCYGREYDGVSNEEKALLSQTEAYQSMPVYPHRDSAAIIDDVIVIKLSE